MSIDWTIDLMEAKGLKCSLEPGFPDPDGVIDVPPASHNFWNDEVPFGALFGAPLEAQTYAQIFTEDLGGEIHYNTKGLYLIRDDDNTGRVSAVVAQNADGNYVKYAANKAVVLATGDFSKDRDMMARYCPFAYDIFKDYITWDNINYDVVKYAANKAVVLATGDFSKDRDMMARYCPFAYDIFKDYITWDNINYDVELAYDGLMPGDGQKMGLWVGAAWQKTQPCAPMINGGASGPAHGVISNFLAYDGLMPGDGQKMGLWVGAAWQKTQPCAPMINGGASGPAHGVISNFWGINLDINGERYMNEVTNFAYGAIAKLMLPERTAFAVWDTNYAYTQDQWEKFGCSVGLENGIMPSTPEELIEGWDKNAEQGLVEGLGNSTTYYKADTIEELVDKMAADGINKENALASIERYNLSAKAGVDEEFQVNPEVLYPIETGPFYATKSVGATFLTVCGGLRTNEKMQVCDASDQPIEGLYNTGIMTGDFYANSYNFVMPGQNLGAVCGTLSYLLGRDLAEL